MDPKITDSKKLNQQVNNGRKRVSIVESLAVPEGTDVEFEPPCLGDELLRIPELSLNGPRCL
ncbi:MAG: hypothetical protein OXK20_06815 [Deltaproteobacteria bacterium]|nr:hypothetical protein [Deltaproteobacteria bacterium]